MLKSVGSLNLGYSDAHNYTQRGNKQMLSEVFVRNEHLTRLMQPDVYYLIGEKGTGKTAYATFLSNNESGNDISVLKFIHGTDYERFYELKQQGKINTSGYADIWKTILLLLLAKSVVGNDKILASLFNKSNLNELMQAIDEYYNRAFSPEIITALKIVDNSERAARLVSKHAEVGGGKESTVETSGQGLQMNLLYVSKKFSDCLGKLKLKKNLTLYIDGIDIRPNEIPYKHYLKCIKGLATACWTLNTELFANVRDSKGQFRVVLLLRPDIFNSLNLQNATNKLMDNAVYLDWRTTYVDYKTSNLYKMSNKLLLYSQDNKDITDIWEQYFDWSLHSSNLGLRKDTAFMEFLRISLSRPRDIQTILNLIQKIMKAEGKGSDQQFSYKSYSSDLFQNRYSEYFFSSLKDQLSFYYSEEDYKLFRKFFDFFDNQQFTYDDYQSVYKKYEDYILENAKEDIPKYIEDPKSLLQLLYDSNVLAAIEFAEDDHKYFHFSYREKSLSNIAPEVPYGENIEYRFHYGLYKKAKMGRY